MSKQIDHSKNAAEVYNKVSKTYFEKFHETCEYIDEFINLMPMKGHVLDVGCGTGTNSGYLLSHGFSVIGVDISSGMLKIARKMYPKIKFTKMDMRKLKFNDYKFDGILVSYSLFHVPDKDIKKALMEFKRVLKDGGIIYFALQEGSGEKIMTETLNPKFKVYIRFFEMKEFIDILNRLGFVILMKRKRKPYDKFEFWCNKFFVIAKKSE